MSENYDDHHYEARKHWRQERKRVSRKDRSKYKKTDQDKLRKQPTSDWSHLPSGRVLSVTAQAIEVDCQGKRYACVLRRTLLQEKQLKKQLVTVGDIVYFEPSDEEEGAISAIAPRYSVLSRADPLSQKREQLIAANLDQVLITTSVVSPPLKPFLIDRYIIATKRGNMEPVILINKVDLLGDQRHELEKIRTMYDSLGITCLALSTKTGEGIERLRKIMRDKASVFTGQSGVGKSSLINAITGLSLQTGDVIAKTRKGAHVTTRAALIPLEDGGWCIDTPGIKSFGLWALSADDVQQYYTEIQELGAMCRYPNCSHTHEPGCHLQHALDRGEIHPMRYRSYVALLESLKEEVRRR